MMAPNWVEDTIRQFARGANFDDLTLSPQGVAAIRFENGIVLRFEYFDSRLVISASIACANDERNARRILAFSHPAAIGEFRIRSGYLAKTGRAIFVVMLEEREVGLPALNGAFTALWKTALEIGGSM